MEYSLHFKCRKSFVEKWQIWTDLIHIRLSKDSLQPTNYADLTIYKPFRWLQESMLTKHMSLLAAQLFQCSSYNDR